MRVRLTVLVAALLCAAAAPFATAQEYFSIEKYANGQEADTPPGPIVATGDVVQWTYVITNLQDATLFDITVTDDQGVVVTCPATTLAGAESMTCTGSGVAAPGQYVNVGTVTATPAGGEESTASDAAYSFGQAPAGPLDLEKLTNGDDADFSPGPTIFIGDPVEWTYIVTNRSDGTVTEIAVTDDQGVTVTCPATSLAPGASMTCTGSGTAIAGQYANVGTGTALSSGGEALADTDASHYLGVRALADIQKLTNGEDADTAPGPSVLQGSPVAWSYVVTNLSRGALYDVAVSDSDPTVTVSCPLESLEPEASMTCTASGVAIAGQYENTGTVTASTEEGQDVLDSDASHYLGLAVITLEKVTNGVDADTPPGPSLIEGAPVTWTYLVTNTGPETLTAVAVSDDQGVTVTCPGTTLAPGASLTCTASGEAQVGQYANIGLVTARNASAVEVTASDPSHYFGRPRLIPVLGSGGIAALCLLIGFAGVAILRRG